MVAQTRLTWLSLRGKRHNISNQQMPNTLFKPKVNQIEVVHEEAEEVSEEAGVDVDLVALAVAIEVFIEVPKTALCVTIVISTDTPAQSAVNAYRT